MSFVFQQTRWCLVPRRVNQSYSGRVCSLINSVFGRLWGSGVLSLPQEPYPKCPRSPHRCVDTLCVEWGPRGAPGARTPVEGHLLDVGQGSAWPIKTPGDFHCSHGRNLQWIVGLRCVRHSLDLRNSFSARTCNWSAFSHAPYFFLV